MKVKVFISWSGEISRALAEVVKDWIGNVLQATDPWISSKDLDRGSVWFSEIYSVIEEAPVGIICLTADNKEKPWILFEAGALAKGQLTNRVYTLLFDLRPRDIQGPLAQFHHTETDKESMLGLLKSLNAKLGEASLTELRLLSAFDAYWPKFETALNTVRSTKPVGKPMPTERSAESLLGEVLELTRTVSHRIETMMVPIPYHVAPGLTVPLPTFVPGAGNIPRPTVLPRAAPKVYPTSDGSILTRPLPDDTFGAAVLVGDKTVWSRGGLPSEDDALAEAIKFLGARRAK